jgi:hypothetical protein
MPRADRWLDPPTMLMNIRSNHYSEL